MIRLGRMNGNCIYVSQKEREMLNLCNGETYILRISNDGKLIIEASTTFRQIDAFFDDMDDELKSLFLNRKNHKYMVKD